MSFDLKTTVQPNAELSPQQKKLNCLIEKIEQQKLELEQWQQAKDEIQQYTQQHLMPVYRELYVVLFEQMQQLWNSLNQHEFSRVDMAQLDDKIYALAAMLKESKALNQQQLNKVDELYNYYQQSAEYAQAKKSKNKASSEVEVNFDELNDSDQVESDAFEEWDTEQYSQAREQAKLKRQQENRAQAEKMAEQSLKTVYLKIAATIHPDREPDETKKAEKTELLQVVNQAHEAQDLFYLLKLQLQLETNKGKSPKALSDEHLKFYKMALEAQSQRLTSQIDDITDSFHWSEKPKPKNMQIKDVYKVIDGDVSVLKEQVKWEKERLKYMEKVKGLEVLLENEVL